jgi:hypothetical protein
MLIVMSYAGYAFQIMSLESHSRSVFPSISFAHMECTMHAVHLLRSTKQQAGLTPPCHNHHAITHDPSRYCGAVGGRGATTGHRPRGVQCRGPCAVPHRNNTFLNPCAYSYVKGHIDLLGVQSNHILCSMWYPACRRRERVALCKVKR